MIEERGPLPSIAYRMIDALSRAADGQHDEQYQDKQLLLASHAFDQLCQQIRREGKTYRSMMNDLAVEEGPAS